MVSIIVPIYNAEKKLRRCVESILSQTFSDFELILVDDGSSDNSPAICDELQLNDNRIRVFHKANSGASSTRNFGIKKAKGEYLTFSAADDWVAPTWLEKMIDNIPDTDLVIQGYIWHQIGMAPIKQNIANNHVYCENYSSICFNLLKTAHMGYLWTMLFKSEIIRKYHIFLYENMTFHEDLDFILRYLLHTKSFKTIDACGYHYYYEPKSYYHTVKGCYSITLSLEKILSGFELEYFTRVYRTNAYTALLHNHSAKEIFYAKCYMKRFKWKSNGITATAISYILRFTPSPISSLLIDLLACIKNGQKK